MKLYTEEQLKKAIELALHGFGIGGIEDTIEVVASKFTPIELPSDEEVEKQAEHEDTYSKKCAFTRGAKWMWRKTFGGNK